jgi:hypothetical protein
LRAQGNKFAEQRFVHCGPIDGSGDIGGSLTPQIGDPALHHKDQLVCGGEQAIPKKACDLHGARWLFDLDKTSRLKEKSVYIAAIYQPILGILAIHAKPCQPYTLITRNSPF